MSRVWIIVNDNRGLAEASDSPYAMCFTTKPTVYRSYRDAENAKRRQVRSYRRVLARSTDEDMGSGFRAMLRGWIRNVNIIGIEMDSTV